MKYYARMNHIMLFLAKFCFSVLPAGFFFRFFSPRVFLQRSDRCIGKHHAALLQRAAPMAGEKMSPSLRKGDVENGPGVKVAHFPMKNRDFHGFPAICYVSLPGGSHGSYSNQKRP